MALDKTQKLEKKYHFQTYKRYPITLTKGEGTRAYDSNGNEYIDALAGIAVNSVGHCHPKVVAAIKNQAEKLIHCSNFYYNEPQSKLAELLAESSGFDRVFLCNSGAEAMEAAIKLARKHGYKKGKKGDIISFENCFHGRTLATVAMGKGKYQEGFGPMPEGFKTLPFNDVKALRENMNKDVKAVVVEPVQGEGGIVPARKEFLKEIQKACDENDALLIFDEIQCGMGRVGELYAYKYFDIKPDIITLAKALGGGAPIGAMLTKEEIAKTFEFGNHGTTFGGNPLACAAAFAALSVIIEENLPQQAKEKGEYFISKIKEKTSGIDGVKEIRGIGLMIGVQLNFKCAGVVDKMRERGVLANCAAEYVIRLVPPLTIPKNEINKIIDVMVESIREAKENG